jgi:hypothetical protein
MSASRQAGNQACSRWRPWTNRGLVRLPSTDSTGQVMAAACAGPKLQLGPGSSRSKGDGATQGVARQVGASHPEVVQEPHRVVGLLGDAGRPRVIGGGAAAETSPVVADPLEAPERRFGHQRLQGVGEVGAVDEQHRLARPHHLILEFDPVDLDVFHDCSSIQAGPLLRWRRCLSLRCGDR